MRMDDQGVLLSSSGHPVAWDGPRGTLNPLGGPVSVDERGNVHQDGAQLGTLQLTDFVARDRLARTRDGLFVASPGLQRTAARADVHQGAVEQSNATGIDELVQLITIQRNHESASRVLGLIDQTYQRLHQRR